MTIFNFGSINLDHIYQLDAFPAAGETLPALSQSIGFGGKGANQSVAAARAGSVIHHIGAVGQDGGSIVAEMQASGVNVDAIAEVKGPTGHAIINVDGSGENTIVIASGANHWLDETLVRSALKSAATGDWFILQNETNFCVEAAKIAHQEGLRVLYSAAPFDADMLRAILPFCELVVLNQGEYEQAKSVIASDLETTAKADWLVTKGKHGATLKTQESQKEFAAYKVDVVDTTGAGDTFLGYFVAALDMGKDMDHAVQRAMAAAALQVGTLGAMGAIPKGKAVDKFMSTSRLP